MGRWGTRRVLEKSKVVVVAADEEGEVPPVSGEDTGMLIIWPGGSLHLCVLLITRTRMIAVQRLLLVAAAAVVGGCSV